MIRPLAALLAAAAAGGAWADEPNPYYLGVTQSLTHDSNVFSAPGSVGDYYSSTGLTGGFDQSIGRQHLYANANVRYNKYRDVKELDNTSYGVAAGWDWSTIEQLSGNLTVGANQGLATSGGNATLAPNERNVVKNDQIGTAVRWGGAGALSLEGSYSHSRVRYSAASFFASQSSADSASANAFYRLSPDIRLGAGLRFSRTRSPYGIALVPNPTGPDDYTSNSTNGRNLDLFADWSVTAQSGVNARVSWTRQSNSAADSLDFSGLTGAVSARYAPTAKLSFGASIGRDAGTNGSYFNVPQITPATPATPVTPVGPVQGLSQNAQTTDSYSLTARYAATAKIEVNASTSLYRAKVINTLAAGAVTTTSESTDETRGFSLGADYAVARNWQLGCRFGRSLRKVSGSTNALGNNDFSYANNSVGCTVQFTLR